MKVLILNGSPKKTGTIAKLLGAVADGAGERHDVEWFNIGDLNIRPCLACMQCRPDGECVLPEDDAHRVGRIVRGADAIVIGTPTYWGNMSGQLKVLFDRIVTSFIGEGQYGQPLPRHKGKPAIILTSCSAPRVFDLAIGDSRGTLRSVRKITGYGGYKVIGQLVAHGTKGKSRIPQRLKYRARSFGEKL